MEHKVPHRHGSFAPSPELSICGTVLDCSSSAPTDDPYCSKNYGSKGEGERWVIALLFRRRRAALHSAPSWHHLTLRNSQDL